ncbi:MAG: TIGR03986 family CRISPR-associated RAMP protein [Calditrichaeota bacterium]|nr:TIGR03986 family CRISPR-associated RAMP protein [Calditrichota bacterium]
MAKREKNKSKRHRSSNNTNQWGFENNPYQFVPHDKNCSELKSEAPSLAKFSGLSGYLVCEITTLTPLFIGGKRHEGEAPKKIDFFEINGKPAIPGSSIRGMLRSVLEAATGSCFSVFDESPLHYRDIKAKVIAGEILELPTDAKPGKIRAMKRAWIAIPGEGGEQVLEIINKNNNKMHTIKFIPSGKQNGDIIWTEIEEIEKYKTSRKAPIIGPFYLVKNYATSSISASGWYEGKLKITGKTIPMKKRERVFFPLDSKEIYYFTKKEVEDYQRIVEEQLEFPQNRNRNFMKSPPRKPLKKGMLIYFQEGKTDDNGDKWAHKISYVEVPRVYYDTSRGDLIKEMGLQKCETLEFLCPVCRLFGFTGEKQALRSRIQISDAIHTEGAGPEKDYWAIKLLGTPHPTSCNIYLKDPTDKDVVRNYDGIKLDNKGNPEDPKNKDGTKNIKWKGPVEIRGRKFYFHHPNQNKLYYCVPTNYREQEEMRSQVRPVLDGNVFEFRIDFQNLAQEELGMLIWGLELHGNLHHKLGMGKPIGFGSIRIEIIEAQVENDLTSKYIAFEQMKNKNGGSTKNIFNKFEYLNSFLVWIKEKTGKEFLNLNNVEVLSKILDINEGNTSRKYPTEKGFEFYRNLKGKPFPNPLDK